MTILAAYRKPVGKTADYDIDWSRWLDAGDTVVSVAWTVPAGITSVDQSNTTTRGKITLSGGTAGTEYIITGTATTANGLVEPQSILIEVE